MESVAVLKLSSLAGDIHVKRRETLRSTDLNMQEVLGIDKALVTILVELVNFTSNLTRIDRCIKKR